MRPEMFKARLCDLENASAITLVFKNNNIDTTVPRPRPLNSKSQREERRRSIVSDSPSG